LLARAPPDHPETTARRREPDPEKRPPPCLWHPPERRRRCPCLSVPLQNGLRCCTSPCFLRQVL